MLLKSTNGTTIEKPFLFNPDPNNSNELYYNMVVQDKVLFGYTNRLIKVQYSAVFTDYTNYLVFYQCYQTWVDFTLTPNMDAYVLVRNKNFDSLSQFLFATTKLEQYKVDFNKFVFLQNSAC